MTVVATAIRRFAQLAPVLVLLVACSARAREAPDEQDLGMLKPVGGHELHNAYWITAQVINGAQPEGEAAFKKLQTLGVKTVISVDGAKPDLALAKKYGLKYIHLPIGYDSVPAERAKEIAKAFAEKEGPFYVHCHHGRHRSPAAAAVALVTKGDITNDQALAAMKIFGTNPKYKGLWQDAREAQPCDAAVLRALKVEYVEVAQIPHMADAMVKVDYIFEHLKDVRKAGFKIPPDHPDIDPPHEALLLREMYHELGRSEAIKEYPADYLKRMKSAEEVAKELEDALAAYKKAGYAGDAPANLEAAFQAMEKNCNDCHGEYRNVPQPQLGK